MRNLSNQHPYNLLNNHENVYLLLEGPNNVKNQSFSYNSVKSPPLSYEQSYENVRPRNKKMCVFQCKCIVHRAHTHVKELTF